MIIFDKEKNFKLHKFIITKDNKLVFFSKKKSL